MSVPNNANPVNDEVAAELVAISERLVAARTNAEPLPSFPGQLPDKLDDAYTIQTTSIKRWPDEIGGWKVGGVPAAYQHLFTEKRLSGPIFRSTIVDVEADASQTMPIFKGGFAAVEAEFVVQIAKTITPNGKDYSNDELGALISALHVGAEIASSPMAAVNALGPCSIVSDFGNNAGLLVGPRVLDWQSLNMESLTAAVTIDDVVVGETSDISAEDGFYKSLRFLVNLCARRGIALNEGTLVSCGALTGVHEVTVDSNVHVDFGSLGAFNVTFESMLPKQ